MSQNKDDETPPNKRQINRDNALQSPEQKIPSHMQAFNDQAVGSVNTNYATKEEKLHHFLTQFNSNDNNESVSQVADEYEEIIVENVEKLKGIIREDFKSSAGKSKKLVDETKIKLHDFITKIFQDRQSNERLVSTLGAMFQSVNKKIKDDMKFEIKEARRTSTSLSPDYTNVFVPRLKKSPQEIEAERLLRELFEDELCEFNKQIMKDLKEVNTQMKTTVQNTMAKVREATAFDPLKNMPEASITKQDNDLPFNVPATKKVENSLNALLSQTATDFQKVKENMLNDVQNQKQKINQTANYYSEQFLGKGIIEEENED